MYHRYCDKLQIAENSYDHRLYFSINQRFKNSTLYIMNVEQNIERDLAKQYLLNTKEHVFLTGRAGSGKTTLLQEVIKATDKNTVVVAPTGVAAINAGGVTIHSFFQLPPSNFLPVETSFMGEGYTTRSLLKQHLKVSEDKRRLIQELEMLIIDEISMVRADLLDAIDFTLRYLRGSTQPFGEVQVVMVGDLYQLPPVVNDAEWSAFKDYYNTPYFFDSLVWKQAKMIPLELKKVYRQKDQDFLNVLNNIRDGKPRPEDLALLNTRHVPAEEASSDAILLTTHNRKADRINQKELEAIKSPKLVFEAKVAGKFNEWTYPAAEKMILKKGAKVMFIRNDREQRYYNGKLAEVVSYDAQLEKLKVKFQDDQTTCLIEKALWENIKYGTEDNGKITQEVTGSFTQFPVRLAWAVTVHKSQGLTLEAVRLDLESSFAAGQTYVALSRCTTLAGLIMTSRILARHVIIDQRIRRFYEGFPASDSIAERLPRAEKAFALYRIQRRFKLYSLMINLQKWKKYVGKSGFSEKTEYTEVIDKIHDALFKLKDTSIEFQKQLQGWSARSMTDDKMLEHLLNRSDKAIVYFANTLFEEMVKPLHQHISDIQHKSKVKKYLSLAVKLYDEIWRKIEQLYSLGLYDKKICTAKEQHQKSDLPDWKSARIQTTKKKGATYDITLEFFMEGMSIPAIAEKRGLVAGTIEAHMGRWLKAGKVKITELLSEERLHELTTAKKQVAAYEGFGDLMSKIKVDCSYSELRWIIWYTEESQMEV